MLLSLHLAPGKDRALPFLRHYHGFISAAFSGYSFDLFMDDFKAALAEGIFFPVGLYARAGIFDKEMMTKGLKTYKAVFSI